MLSTCASPFVTQYKASFLRGHKLWIVMEYLGGGSCLDLVSAILPCLTITDDSLLIHFPAQTWQFLRGPHRHYLPRIASGARVPPC